MKNQINQKNQKNPKNQTNQMKSFYIFLLILFILIISYIIIKPPKEIKVCLCVLGKEENLYAKEYVENYINLGYNHIFIYDNNDIEGEKFSDVLKEEIDKGYVTIIDYRGKRDNASQSDAYYDCYEKNKYIYDWLSFFDFDEFLQLIPENRTIQDFLNDTVFDDCQNVKLNWVFYNSEKELLYYENKPLKIRLTKNEGASILTKSTVRGKSHINYWYKMHNPHTSIRRYKSCSSSGKNVRHNSPSIDPPDYKNAYLKHYYYKSFEEFCRKLKRGTPDSLSYSPMIKRIFEENKNKTEKLKIIKNVFNITKTNKTNRKLFFTRYMEMILSNIIDKRINLI